MKSVQEKVNSVLQNNFQIELKDLNPSAHVMNDLGLDSLDAADLLVLLEEEMDTTIDSEAFMREDLNLGHVYELVTKMMTSNA